MRTGSWVRYSRLARSRMSATAACSLKAAARTIAGCGVSGFWLATENDGMRNDPCAMVRKRSAEQGADTRREMPGAANEPSLADGGRSACERRHSHRICDRGLASGENGQAGSPPPTWGRVRAGEASEDRLAPKRGFPLPDLPRIGGGGT